MKRDKQAINKIKQTEKYIDNLSNKYTDRQGQAVHGIAVIDRYEKGQTNNECMEECTNECINECVNE